MLKEVVCADIDDPFEASLGEAKSNRSRFGPGVR